MRSHEARAGTHEQRETGGAVTGGARLRVVVVTNLIPNRGDPARGIFNLRQLAALSAHCDVAVIAPVHWVPRVAGTVAPRWKSSAAIPRRDTIGGLAVRYVRYLVMPRALRSLRAAAAARALRRPLAEAAAEGRVDIVLATWAYPDVVAAVTVAGTLGLPVVGKLHGSDVRRAEEVAAQRRAVVRALRRTRRVVAVSRSLADQVAALGLGRGHVEIVPNGVDLDRFGSRDRAAARHELGLPPERPHVVFVGRLETVKGPDVLIAALGALDPSVAVTFVGDGALARSIEAAARSSGVAHRVRLAGARPPDEIPTWLAAADVVCVPSRAEGFSNVTLEGLACGRPVVGSRVGGIPDLVTGPELGTLVAPADVEELGAALNGALRRRWSSETIRAAAGPFTWERSASRLLAVLKTAAGVAVS